MMDARWYSLNRNGLATLCMNEADAKAEAARLDRTYPQGAPHQAVQLVEASRVIEEREACATTVWMTLIEAESDGADDLGLDGWMREAEARIRARP